jgi:23S rRNA (uridine2552-2'-O)-methyltransferase
MSKSSKQWLQHQNRDPFVKQARVSDYRSRAVFKLQEIDQKDRIFHKGQVVVDLGAAPGSWSEYARSRIGTGGMVLAVDLLQMEPIPNVLFIKGDFSEAGVYQQSLASLPGQAADLVISDMAPNLTGIRSTDQARSMHLAELVFDFSCLVLRKQGTMLIKMFQGQGTDEFTRRLRQQFHEVRVRKPMASKDKSREFYILAQGYDV